MVVAPFAGLAWPGLGWAGLAELAGLAGGLGWLGWAGLVSILEVVLKQKSMDFICA